MIRYFIKYTHDDVLEEVKELPKSGGWIHIVDPTVKEIDHIIEMLDIPKDFITDPLDIDERSRIEVDEDGFLIIYRVPVYDEDEELTPYYTMPIGIILKKNYIITVCKRDLPLFDEFIMGRVRSFFTSKRTKFVVQIFHMSIRNYLSLLKDLSKKINEIEKEFYETQKDETLISLKNIEKSLYLFITSLKGNEILKNRIRKFQPIRMYEEEMELLEDIMIENTQAIEMANMYAHNARSLEDHFYSIISNKINNTMKFLTAITFVLMLPTLIASVYGMNVNLPLQDNPYAFWYISIFSVLLTIIAVYILVKRNWF